MKGIKDNYKINFGVSKGKHANYVAIRFSDSNFDYYGNWPHMELEPEKQKIALKLTKQNLENIIEFIKKFIEVYDVQKGYCGFYNDGIGEGDVYFEYIRRQFKIYDPPIDLMDILSKYND